MGKRLGLFAKSLALAFVCALLAVSGSSAQSAKAGGKVTLTFWNGFTGSDGDVLREIVNRFNAQNEGKIEVQMDIMPWAAFFERLPPAIATGTAPSFVLMGVEFIRQYAENAAFKDLSDFWKATGVKEGDYVKNVLDVCKYQGKYYMMPMQYNLTYLYWNKALFKAAKLDPNNPPKTWEELGKYAAKLTDPAKNQYGFGMSVGPYSEQFISLIWGNGGEVFDGVAKKSLLDSPQNVKSFEWLQDLAINKKVTPLGATGPDLDNLLQSGKLAMYISGPWQVNGLKNAGIDFGIGAQPKGSKAQAATLGGCGYGIPASTNDDLKPAIYAFFKYWMSQSVLKEWTLRNGFPAFSNAVINDPEVKRDPVQKAISSLGMLGRDYDLQCASGPRIAEEAVRPMVESIIMGAVKPAAAIKKASAKIDEIFAEE